MFAAMRKAQEAELARQAATALGAPTKEKRGRGRPTEPNSTRSIANAKKERDVLHSGVVASVVKLLQEQKTSLADVLSCTAGGRAFPELSGLRRDVQELTTFASNTNATLSAVGHHNNKPLHASLLQGVSKATLQKYCTSVNARFAANAMTPSYLASDDYAKAGLFTEQYAHGVIRQKIHDGEIEAELHWATTVEFHPHSGDTTETYYRIDSNVCLSVCLSRNVLLENSTIVLPLPLHVADLWLFRTKCTTSTTEEMAVDSR
jgi:hypothetical protein